MFRVSAPAEVNNQGIFHLVFSSLRKQNSVSKGRREEHLFDTRYHLLVIPKLEKQGIIGPS